MRFRRQNPKYYVPVLISRKKDNIIVLHSLYIEITEIQLFGLSDGAMFHLVSSCFFCRFFGELIPNVNSQSTKIVHFATLLLSLAGQYIFDCALSL